MPLSPVLRQKSNRTRALATNIDLCAHELPPSIRWRAYPNIVYDKRTLIISNATAAGMICNSIGFHCAPFVLYSDSVRVICVCCAFTLARPRSILCIHIQLVIWKKTWPRPCLSDLQCDEARASNRMWKIAHVAIYHKSYSIGKCYRGLAVWHLLDRK